MSSHWPEGAYVCSLIGQKYPVSVPSLVFGNQCLDSNCSVGTCVVTVLSLVKGSHSLSYHCQAQFQSASHVTS